MNNTPPLQKLHHAVWQAAHLLDQSGQRIQSSTLQGRENPPEMVEILNYAFTVIIPATPTLMAEDVKPNLPWADEHFLERVGRKPVNPGETWKTWPYARSADTFRGDKGAPDGLFTHTYMERIWPINAGQFYNSHCEYKPAHGIRYDYGDLDDVVSLLVRDPYTRQAYLPIWFPEDTGANHGGRVPCTLGYQFIRRGNWLHCYYPIRSCDFVRHFRDDIYLACRLVAWVIEQLCQIRTSAKDWAHVTPGTLTMHATSMHCFVSDMQRVKAEANLWRDFRRSL